MASDEAPWWTQKPYGFAWHGSQLQTQLYVSCRSDELTARVLEALPTLAARRPTLRWVAPFKQDDVFVEPRDGRMLEVLGLGQLTRPMAEFWPARGPVWDALARCEFDDGSRGVLLAEGKSWPGEMYSAGTQAGKSGSDASTRNLLQIERAVAWTQERIGVPVDVKRWVYPPPGEANRSRSLYQTANRLAYTVWLRSQGVEAWLCHLLFVDDAYKPTGRADWRAVINEASELLGIRKLTLDFAGHAYLDGLVVDDVLDALWKVSGRVGQ